MANCPSRLALPPTTPPSFSTTVVNLAFCVLLVCLKRPTLINNYHTGAWGHVLVRAAYPTPQGFLFATTGLLWCAGMDADWQPWSTTHYSLKRQTCFKPLVHQAQLQQGEHYAICSIPFREQVNQHSPTAPQRSRQPPAATWL